MFEEVRRYLAKISIAIIAIIRQVSSILILLFYCSFTKKKKLEKKCFVFDSYYRIIINLYLNLNISKNHIDWNRLDSWIRVIC